MSTNAELDILVKARDEASGTLRKIGDTATSTGSKFARFGASIKSAARVAGLAIVGLGAIASVGIKKSIDAASDLNESMSKTIVVFGKSANVITDWATTSATALGISQQEALEATSTFGNLFTAMKFSQPVAASMSRGMVQLAADLASFNNADPNEVLVNLRAGLLGEAEPLRKFGVQLSAVRIETEAARLGLEKQNGVFTAAAKAQAAYNIIVDDTRTAQGDFARTATGVANRQRIVAAQFKDLQAKIGAFFLPIWQRVLGALQAGMAWFTKISDIVGKRGLSGVMDYFSKRVEHAWKMGKRAFRGLSDGAKGLAIAAVAVGAVLSFAFAPIILILGAIIAVGYLLVRNWDTIKAAASRVWNAVKPVAEAFGKVLWDAFSQIAAVVKEDLWPALKQLWDALKPLWPVVKLIGIAIAVTFLVPLYALVKVLPTLITWVSKAIGAIAGMIKPIAEVVGWVAQAVLWIGDKLVGAFQAFARTVSAGSSIWGGMVAAATSAFNAIANLWNSTIGSLSFTIPSWVPGIGGNSFSIPKIGLLGQGTAGAGSTSGLHSAADVHVPAVTHHNGGNNQNSHGRPTINLNLDRRKFVDQMSYDSAFGGDW